MVSSQKDTGKLDVPKEWKQWLSEINDVLSLISVSQSIPGAIIQVGYENETYGIQFLGEGLEHKLRQDKKVNNYFTQLTSIIGIFKLYNPRFSLLMRLPNH